MRRASQAQHGGGRGRGRPRNKKADGHLLQGQVHRHQDCAERSPGTGDMGTPGVWEEKKDEYISLDYCARLGSLDSSLGRLMVEEGLEETRS